MSGKVREYKLAVHTGCGKSLIDCNCMGDGATTGQVQTAIDKRDVEPLVEAARAFMATQDRSLPLESAAAMEANALRDLRAALHPFEDQEGS